jgi:photosystem II stability/assembly factor-like uncharacterized protein
MRSRLISRLGPAWIGLKPARGGVSVLILLVALLTFAPAVAAATWHAVGPDGADVTALAFDPTDPSVVYAGTSAGLYRSTDAGVRWRLLSPVDTVVCRIAVHPAVPQQVWVVGGAYGGPLMRSFDGGRTFTPCAIEGSYGGVSDVALDPDDPETAYASDLRQVWVTRDGGVSWRVALPDFKANRVLAASGMVWVMSDASVMRSTDHGTTWQVCSLGFEVAWHLEELVRDPQRGRLWLASYPYGLCVSSDDGVSWSRVSTGGGHDTTEVAVAPSAPDTIIVEEFDGMQYTLFKTTDAGVHWVGVGSGPPKRRYISFVDLLFDPRDADRLLWVGLSGVVASQDGGHTWVRSDRGLFNTTVTALLSAADGTLWAAAELQGIFRSADGGRTWTYAGGDLPYGAHQDECVDFSVNAFAATSVGFFAGATWGLYVTRDRGTTWAKVALPQGSRYGVRALLEDPARPGTLVVAAASYPMCAGGGLFVSNDGGQTWKEPLEGPGVDGVAAVALAIDPRDGALIASAATYTTTSEIWHGLLRSMDHGASWSQTGTLPPSGYIDTLLADPVVPGRFHAVDSWRIYRSDDAGASWQLTLDYPPSCCVGYAGWPEVLRADAANSMLLAGVACDIYASRDRGLSWQRLEPDLPWKGTHALAFNREGKVVAGTEGWSVFLLEPLPVGVRQHLPRAR